MPAGVTVFTEESPASMETAPATVRPMSRRRRVPWSTLAITLGLFVLALAVRWWGLAGQARAMWGDEAQLMIEARKFIQGVYTTPFIVDRLGLSALYEYILSFPLRLAGHMDVTVARGVSGALGALSVPLLYLTARELGYSWRVGLVAAVGLATTFWDVSFSRLVLPNIMATSATSVAVLLLVLAVRRANLLLAALSGVALAADCYAHLSGMIVVPLVAGWLALLIAVYSRWWRRTPKDTTAPFSEHASPGATRRLRPRLRRAPLLDLDSDEARPRMGAMLTVAVVCGLAALLCAWPLLQLYFSVGSALAGHAGERFILSAGNRAAFAALHPEIGSSLPGLLWYQFKAAVGMFTVRGEGYPIFNLNARPLLDPISSPLLVLGLASLLFTLRRPASALVLLWLGVPVVLGTMLTTGTFPWTPPPSFHRSIAAAPAMCLCVALGLELLLSALGDLARQAFHRASAAIWWPRLRAGIVLAAALAIGVLGNQRYWQFAGAAVTRQSFYVGAHEWSLLLSRRGAIPVTVLAPVGYPGEYATLYAPRAPLCNGRWYDSWSACPPARLIIFDNDQQDALQYGRLSGRPVHSGPSDDQTTRFWYVEGTKLPDPAHLLSHV